MENHSTLIIGAGLSGLSCAYHLGRDYLIVEKETEPGGIVRTRVRHGGFLCDGTGHWLHLRNAEIKELVSRLLPGQMGEHERRAVIHMCGVFTQYPFQANTYGLPAEVVLECVLGLLRAVHPEDFGLRRLEAAPRNFKEWLIRCFGEGIARYFMVPYNQKLLGVSLEELRPEYAERFIPRPSVEDVIKGALGFSRESLGYNARFLYPRSGGIGTLPKAFAAALTSKPNYGLSVVRVQAGTRTAVLSDGREVHYSHLVNTVALPRFLQMIEDLPPAIREAAGKLRATTVYYYDIGVRGQGAEASAYHWIYFPEPQFVFYRVGSYSAVNPNGAPAGCRSYYVELSGVQDQLAAPEKLKARVLEDLRRARVLAPDDEVLFMEPAEIPYAYVIFDHNYESCRKVIFDYLAQHQIATIGRWGSWGYGGMEDAMLDGKHAASQITKK